jgi:hypothetical protein
MRHSRRWGLVVTVSVNNKLNCFVKSLSSIFARMATLWTGVLTCPDAIGGGKIYFVDSLGDLVDRGHLPEARWNFCPVPHVD